MAEGLISNKLSLSARQFMVRCRGEKSSKPLHIDLQESLTEIKVK